ncbi:MAG: hypothetical protein ACKV19_10770 [Verrucomicrobiales bacterium]
MVSRLPVTVFVIMAGFIVAMAGVTGFVAWRTWRLGRWVARASSATAAGAENGLVAVEGRATAPPGGVVPAGLSRVPCCWYRCTVEEYVKSPSGGSQGKRWHWTTIESQTSGRGFLLADATGQRAVWPEAAEVYPTDRARWHGSTRRPSDPPPSRGSPGDRPMGEANIVVMGQPAHRYRYTEECVYPGDALFVVGWASRSRSDHGEAESEDTDESDGEDEGEEEDLEDGEDVDQRANEQDEAAVLFEEESQDPPPGIGGDDRIRSHLAKPPPGRGAFVISSLGREATMALHRRGVLGAGFITLLLLAGLIWLVMARVA